MGVPVITLAGKTHASRVGLSILENSGLCELVSLTPDQYVQKAISLAGDPVQLFHYRHALRAQLLDSTFTDSNKFTADLEQAYQGMLQIG